VANEPESYSYSRYLNAKKTVDDRSLNHNVWKTFLDVFPAASASGDDAVKVLEVGGGVGATVERIGRHIDDLATDAINYTMVDVREENLDLARELLPEWGRENGFDVWATASRVALTRDDAALSIELVHGDVFDVLDTSDRGPYDVVIAQAVLDILDVSSALSRFRDVTAEGGLWYFPIHFDGVTAFEPVVDQELDDQIEALFHASMDERGDGSTGGARTGRRLFTALRDAGANILKAGASDWVVHSQKDGSYVGDEKYFLHHILHFVESELTNHPHLDSDAFHTWMKTRRQHVESGKLVYLAHQLDLLASL